MRDTHQATSGTAPNSSSDVLGVLRRLDTDLAGLVDDLTPERSPGSRSPRSPSC